MELRRLISCSFSCIWGGLLSAALASAAYNVPQFTLSHKGSQTGFTNTPNVTVTISYPTNPHSGTLWCITQDSTLDYCQTDSNWTSTPTSFILTGGDGLNTVYLEYKYGGTTSPAGEAQITLDQGPPTVTLAEPTGLPGAVAGGLQQVIDIEAQYITGSVSDAVATDPVTVTLEACTKDSVCTEVDSISGAAAPFVWPWPVNDVASDMTYVQIKAANAAGGSSTTAVPNPATVFSVIAPASLTSPYTCTSTTCPVLAGTASSTQYMPNDPPSPAVDGETLTGYADPSMRRDPEISEANPNGTNLWMLYVYPEVQKNDTYGTTSEMVETHLASSVNSGATWQAWCAPLPCSQETPIWPSYHWPPTKSRKEQYSSHGVPNFWPYSSDGVNWQWYAVHLMFFVQPPKSVPVSITDNGCLVTTVASSPYQLGLGWTAVGQAPPDSCSAALPANNWAITYSALTAAAGSHAPSGVACQWGEPAIMVQDGVAYMAASCFDASLRGYGYYIFANTLDSNGGLSGPWTYYGGPFFADVKHFAPKAQFVTEFDWALRSDGSIVAVVSPAAVTDKMEEQYGCVALDFTLTGGFGDALIAVNDKDPEETDGPNACTYEPTSNTGMLIVRRLVSGSDYTAWSIIPTGVMP